MNETALITVTSLPEIQENLRLLRERWEQKAADAASMVCTEETVQTIKKMRAEMRKEFEEADRQRKAAKAMYLAPWDAVEKTFKECVANAATNADKSFKATIDEFEGELKERCRKDMELYFSEMCAVLNVDFITFDKAMELGKIRISLSDARAKTPRQLQDAIAEVVSRVSEDADRIQGMDDAAEIMAEYKACFDVGKAVATVQERKRKIEAERMAAESRRSAQEAAQASVDKVLAAATPLPEETSLTEALNQNSGDPLDECVFEEFTFTVFNCTRKQLINIRTYLKQEGIQYE